MRVVATALVLLSALSGTALANIPKITTSEFCGKVKLVVDNPTNESVPFEYVIDGGEVNIIEVKAGKEGSVEWQFKNMHTIRYRLFVENRPEWSIPWQQVETLYDGCANEENIHPDVTIGQ